MSADVFPCRTFPVAQSTSHECTNDDDSTDTAVAYPMEAGAPSWRRKRHRARSIPGADETVLQCSESDEQVSETTQVRGSDGHI